MKKVLLTLLLLIAIIPMSISATEIDVTPVEQVEETAEVTNTTTPDPDPIGEIIKNEPQTAEELINQVQNSDITVEDAGNHLLKKMYEVADMLKKFVSPIMIIMFVVGAIWMVVGALGKKDGISKGLTVCVLAVVMFAVCYYAEPIIMAFTTWIAS